MADRWTCLQCGAVHPMGARHCSACGAARPPMAEAQAAEAPAVVQEPPPPELLSGLARLVRAAAEGEVEPVEFSAHIRVGAEAMEAAFDDIVAGLRALPGDAPEEYAEAVRGGVQDARALFHLAFAELEAYGADSHPARLRLGMLLAEKGQEQYARLLEGVREDAAGHPFSGRPDVVRRLAGEALEGRLSLEDYREGLDRVQQELDEQLERARRDLAEGLDRARRFDGVQPAPVQEAAEILARAAERLGRIILRLHEPEAG